MTTLYGIKNCDTMKKAVTWLSDNGVEFEFHDFKKAGLDEATLKGWVKQVGWEVLINKRGLTWRKLPDTDKEGVDETKAITLMMNNLSLIKRPVLDTGNGLHIGFKAEQYETLFK